MNQFRESATIALADFSVAFIAGLVVFPVIYALGLQSAVSESTVGALFISLPGAFHAMGAAGRVVGVGPGVDTVAVGDPVMAVAGSALSRYATTPAYLVAPRPAGLTDEEAAAVPVAFLTAVYGLEYLARLAAGETVLKPSQKRPGTRRRV